MTNELDGDLMVVKCFQLMSYFIKMVQNANKQSSKKAGKTHQVINFADTTKNFNFWQFYSPLNSIMLDFHKGLTKKDHPICKDLDKCHQLSCPFYYTPTVPSPRPPSRPCLPLQSGTGE